MLLILLVGIVLLSGCATILSGTSQTVKVNSVPSGAKVQVDGIDRGVTPAALKLKKGNEGQIITLKMEGYETKTFQPETSFNGVAILNMFSLLGWGIDAVTGAIYKYSPRYYEVELEKKP